MEVDGFGCLTDLREDLAPGLHLFHGPNESGKSTLQQAVLPLLYGFSRETKHDGVKTKNARGTRPGTEAPTVVAWSTSWGTALGSACNASSTAQTCRPLSGTLARAGTSRISSGGAVTAIYPLHVSIWG
ncbi:MAG: AAA family ATPase [Dehalococcoidia bacterium]|nr:AAA family ATPase [Dehalococcoidia bacterium]